LSKWNCYISKQSSIICLESLISISNDDQSMIPQLKLFLQNITTTGNKIMIDIRWILLIDSEVLIYKYLYSLSTLWLYAESSLLNLLAELQPIRVISLNVRAKLKKFSILIYFPGYKLKNKLILRLTKRGDQALISISTTLKFLA